MGNHGKVEGKGWSAEDCVMGNDQGAGGLVDHSFGGLLILLEFC